MRLVERDEVVSDLHDALQRAREGSGSVALIRGEAGIGKTSVARAFISEVEDAAHILWGACDDLLTARPLGPVWDMAFTEPALLASLEADDRQQTFTTLLELVSRSLRPTVVVVEDAHWADEATLDMVKFLGRRIATTHGLLVITYRDGQVAGDHPLRVALGDLPHASVERVALSPLTARGVAELADDRADADHIWEVSGGNPFFVTELLTSGDEVPLSIRDSLRGRVLRLSPGARDLVELASIAPRSLDIRLAKEVLGEVDDALAECERASLLVVTGDSVAFRHELARRAVEADLAEARRRRLNLTVLRGCEALGEDLARCAHHARAALEPDEMLRLLPEAAHRAAELESHQEAVSHLRALEPFLDRMGEEELADHYHLWAYEEYLASRGGGEGIIEKAIDLRRRLADPEKLGASLLVASRIAWVNLRREAAVEHAREAAEVLQPLGGHGLAMAYSTLSQLAMLANEEAATIEYGTKAIEGAGPGPSVARAHALNNIGGVKMTNHYPEGVAELEESFRLSVELGEVHDQTRAAVNLAWGHLFAREVGEAVRWLNTGLEVLEGAQMPAFESYLVAIDAIYHEMIGDWVAAEAKAQSVLERHAVMETSRTAASIVLARLAARRGLPQAANIARDAWERATTADEIQRMAPAGAVLAELGWLGSDLGDDTRAVLSGLLEHCLELGATWLSGDLAMWLSLADVIDEVPEAAAAPYLLLDRGEWEAAAAFWEERGIPYELGVTLSFGDTGARLRALEIFDRLGAIPLASKTRSELQQAGVKGVPRGPSRATRQSPLGLTPRQTEVLELLAEGLTNAEIADRLFLSTRTVDHHVSAILTRSGAASRQEAAEMARNLGLVG